MKLVSTSRFESREKYDGKHELFLVIECVDLFFDENIFGCQTIRQCYENFRIFYIMRFSFNLC